MSDAHKADTKAYRSVNYDPFSSGKLEKAVPTTEAQREIWATLALESEATLCYNESLSVSVQGALDFEKLNAAYQNLLKRHDALRSFFSPDGKFFFVKEYSFSSLDFVDLSHRANSDTELKALEESQVKMQFDLLNGPCITGTVVKMGPDKFSILLSAHHIVCDGWSFAILLSELSQSYSGRGNPETPTQFSDIALLEDSQGLNFGHKKYWLAQYAKPLEIEKLPLDFPRPTFRTYNSERLDFHVSETTVNLLKKFGASQGSSLYTVLMAAFQIFLSRLTGSEELVVGMASAGQSSLGEKDLIGHMVNLLPLRTNIDQEITVKHFIKDLRSKMLDAFEHQEFSFGTLLKELNLKRDPSEIPLVNIVFNIDQQAPDQGLNFKNLSARYTTIPRDFENFELFVNAVSSGDTLSIECQFNTNLFKASTIKTWFESYIEILQVLPDQINTSISNFKISQLYRPESQSIKVESPKTSLVRNVLGEEKLTAIWKQILNVSDIEPEDNFFTLGGHSLLVIEMIPLIEEALQTKTSARVIFENPTILSLASALNTKEVTKPALESKIPRHEGRVNFPVTHNQMQVWYLEQLYPKTQMHNLPSSIRLKFAVDREALEKTLHLLTRRHSALRTTIVVEEGVPVQKVLSPELPQFAFKLQSEKANEQNIVKLLNKEAEHVFESSTAPLFKAKLFELGEQDFVFYFMPHHSVWDGWSFDIFFDELNTAYSAIAKDQVPVFANKPEVSYGEYALWLQDAVKNGELGNHLVYWKNKLKSPLPVLELPSDFKRPPVASHQGHTFGFQLTAVEAQQLRNYAKKQGSSLFNVFLTAFKVTLARFANLEDVIVGSPVRSRNNPDLLNTIGYFVNTVALRSQIKLNLSFEESLKVVSQTCIEAFDHQTLPFQVVLNNVDHPRDPSRSPIFQTFFSYQDTSNRSGMLNGQPYTQINIDKASLHTDLDLWIKASDKKIEGAFEFRQDLFKDISIENFFNCFSFLLDNLIKHEGTSILSRPILPSAQSEIILKEWNHTETSTTEFQPLHKMFEGMVEKFPGNLAIQNAEGSLSYSELNKEANKVAHSLIARGVAPGDLVGLCLNRDLNMLTSILGIMKVGAGYVPLDPGFPQERLNYMASSSKPKVLISDRNLSKRFPQLNSILVEEMASDSSLSTSNPHVSLLKDATAYVIYTSGSTGLPKGVEVSHNALSNFLVSMGKTPGITSKDKLLAVTTLSFDIATLELYLPLTVGASLYLAGSYDVIDGKALKTIIESNQVNFMQATPSTWRLLLAAGWNGSKDFKVLCGGEPFPKDLAQKLVSICGSVWNMYGPTETTVWSTCYKIEEGFELVSIGKPIDNTYTYILDEGLNLCPIGSSGQLYIGGLGLAKGYFKQPDLTEEKFIPNPFVPGQKMYATGDFARFNHQGELECLGRQDGQVKIRGYRIELGEIESAISKMPSVKENAVITKEVKPGDVRIISFLVLAPNYELQESSLRNSLNTVLPKYMVPSHFVVLEKLPQTLNGKIDKKTLGTLFTDVKPAEETKPVSAFETSSGPDSEIREMWKSILNIDSISDKDNFFNIGGNSLLAVQLFSQIAKKYKQNLPLSILLESSDFRSFVESVRPLIKSQPLVAKGASTLIPLKANGSKNPVFVFHGVGGNVLNYVSLIPAFEADRPLVGVQSIGLNQNIENMTIEEMASFYIKEIQNQQPHGPYFLAGGSMGGVVAFEVAQQLRAQGAVVEKIVMFDTFGPRSNMKSFNTTKRSLFEKIKSAFEYRKKVYYHRFKMKVLKKFGISIPLEMNLFEIELNNYSALWKYKPSVYHGDIHIIRAPLAEFGWYSDPQMGWGSVVKGKIKTFHINGNHSNFIESPELTKVLSGLL